MIKSIMCCCGNGLGSSLIIKMNVETVLKKLGKTGIEILHSSLSDVTADSADLFVIGGDLESFTQSFKRTVLLSNIMALDELEEKLAAVFAEEE